MNLRIFVILSALCLFSVLVSCKGGGDYDAQRMAYPSIEAVI